VEQLLLVPLGVQFLEVRIPLGQEVLVGAHELQVVLRLPGLLWWGHCLTKVYRLLRRYIGILVDRVAIWILGKLAVLESSLLGRDNTETGRSLLSEELGIVQVLGGLDGNRMLLDGCVHWLGVLHDHIAIEARRGLEVLNVLLGDILEWELVFAHI